MLKLGRSICNYLPAAEEREWLVTNGIGGFAAGSISGLLTRRYHGLLVAALEPPLGRTLMLVKFDETVEYQEQQYPLFANRWVGGQVEAAGYHYIEQFHLEGTIPVWTFSCGDAILEKRIWMESGANTTYVQYILRRAAAPIKLSLKAMLNYRDYHRNAYANGWRLQITPETGGIKVHAYEEAMPYYIFSDRAQVTPQHHWYRNFYLAMEAQRGLNAIEDHLWGGFFEAELTLEHPLTLVASTDPTPNLEGQVAYAERKAYEAQLLAGAQKSFPTKSYAKASRNKPLPAWLQHLVLAADQFIVSRPLPDLPTGHTIIAG